MIMVADNTERLARRLRAVLANEPTDDATRAAWRVALLVAVNGYGPALTANALRDLADDLENDLMRGPLQ